VTTIYPTFEIASRIEKATRQAPKIRQLREACCDDSAKVMINDLLDDTNPNNEYYCQKLLEFGHTCYENLVRKKIKERTA
jgi:hypothetical protein